MSFLQRALLDAYCVTHEVQCRKGRKNMTIVIFKGERERAGTCWGRGFRRTPRLGCRTAAAALARGGKHCAAMGVGSQRMRQLQRADERAGDYAGRRARRLRQRRLRRGDEAPHAHGRRVAHRAGLTWHVARERGPRFAGVFGIGRHFEGASNVSSQAPRLSRGRTAWRSSA
jgi:hypothetical protein